MSTALCVEGGAGNKNPARLSVVERIRQIEAAARERDARRLERLEKRAIDSRENEELRLCAMAAGEAVALSCQKITFPESLLIGHTIIDVRRPYKLIYRGGCFQSESDMLLMTFGEMLTLSDIRPHCWRR